MQIRQKTHGTQRKRMIERRKSKNLDVLNEYALKGRKDSGREQQYARNKCTKSKVQKEYVTRARARQIFKNYI